MEFTQMLSWFASLNQTDKISYVEQLIDRCPAYLLEQMKLAIEIKQKRDFISLLPAEIALQIANYLDISDLKTMQLVCQQWKSFVASHGPFWRMVCQRLSIGPDEYSSPEEAIAICKRLLKMNNSDLIDWFKMEAINPDGIFYRHIDCDDNVVVICEGGHPPLVTISSVTNDIPEVTIPLQLMASTVKLHADDLYCGTFIGVTQRYNWRTQELTKVYRQHAGAVFAIDVYEDLLFTGGGDRMISIWHQETGLVLHAIEASEPWVTEIRHWVDENNILYLSALSKTDHHACQALTIYRLNEGRPVLCHELRSGVVGGICVRDAGFHFLLTELLPDLTAFVCCFDGRKLQKTALHLHAHENPVFTVGIGKQYCLIAVGNVKEFEIVLRLFRLVDGTYISYKSAEVFDISGAKLYNSSWLDLPRLSNTHGLALVLSGYGKVYWK